MQENVANTLCYALGFITGILFLVLEPYSKNRNTRFHAWQSIFVFGAIVACEIVLSVVTGILVSTLSVGLIGIIGLLWNVLWIGTTVLWIFLMYKAYNNQRFVVPIVGPLAEKQA